MSENWIEYGKIGRPHGVHGEVRFFLHNQDSPALLDIDEVRLRLGKQELLTRVESIRQGKALVLALEDVPTREEAERWVNARLDVPEGLFEALDEGEFYSYQLEGLTVLCTEGKRRGRVQQLVDFGGGDLLSLRYSGKDYFLPFAAPYIGEIDLEAGTVVVQLLDFEL